ncbi:MAG: protein kinase, partial [Cyanobacteria bacterium J06598_3]
MVKQLFLAQASAKTLETAHRLFDLEAKTLYRLGTHAQIPTLLAHFEHADDFYLVQEYIPGESLYDEFAARAATKGLRHRGPQENPPETLGEQIAYTQALLKDLLTVLAFVHQQNVIHRDIKPANIIRRRSDNQLVLIDFGAVKALNTALEETTIAPPLTVAIGSPGYMPPEQEAGRPCFASDLYAVGMVALEALTGMPPRQLPINPSTGRFDLVVTSDNRGLLDFLRDMTRLDVSARFADGATALQSLEALATQTNSTSVASPATPFPETAFPKTTPSKTVSPHSSTLHPSTPYSPTPQKKSHAIEQRVVGAANYLLSPVESRNRQALLSKVHRFWIQGVLEHSLHGQVLLTLGLEERAAALALPWNITVETSAEPAHPLDSGTRVFDVFEQLGEGRSLLILGEPGAGKTTTLLTLARDLLEVAQQDTNNARIPAIFNLSSWTGGAIDQWLITELNSKYQIPKTIGKTWVDEQQLLLLLDGLDEVRADRQESCAAAINQFHQDYGPELVVCCRLKDYEALEQRLGFQSALYVRSLSDQQIWQYLDTAETGLTGLKSLLERSAAQVPDGETDSETPALLDLARSPLILNIMALTYQGVSASEIPALGTPATGPAGSLAGQGDYTHQLFSAYIERMFERRGLTHEKAPYTKQQTLRWLHVLAQRLTTTSQTVFLIE